MKISASAHMIPTTSLSIPSTPQVSGTNPESATLAVGSISPPINLPLGRALTTLDLASSSAVQNRLQRYYGTSDMTLIQAQARAQLGLEQAQALSPEIRQQNFSQFAARHFPQPPAERDEFDLDTYGPAPGSPLYQLFEAYAATDYGALMVARVLEKGEPLTVKVVPGVSPQAWENLMVFPPEFPRAGAVFTFGGQPVDPLAILHHEFEHTHFGRYPQREDALLQEELHAVRDVENPVRILNGFEPRYTYTQLNAQGQPQVTFAILNPDRAEPGAWTFDPENPARLLPLQP